MAYAVHSNCTQPRLIPGERPDMNLHPHTAFEPSCGVPDAPSAMSGLPVSTQGGSLVLSGIIYKYRGPNGKEYVGQTWREKQRISDHRCGHTKCLAFASAINKYGFHSFEYAVLHSGITDQQEMDRLEQYEIATRNTISPNGYNLRSGGMAGLMSDASRQKIKDSWRNEKKRSSIVSAMKLSANTPKRKAELRQNSINNANNPELKKRLSLSLKKAFASDAVRKKRSEQRMAQWRNLAIRQKMINGLKEMASTKEFKDRCAEILRERWKNPEYRKKMIQHSRALKMPEYAIRRIALANMSKVRCVETGIIYESLKSASESTKTNRTCISMVLSGRRNKAGGFRWEYAK